MISALLDRWLRRYWRPDEQALARCGTGLPAIVITGASEGIGLALAHRFAASGKRGEPSTTTTLVMIGRRAEPLVQAARDVVLQHGVETIPLAIDITTRDAADRIAQELSRRGLYVDVLVNNAGLGLGGPFASHDPDAIAALLDTNVTALTLLTRHFLPDMCVRGRGGIVNVASLGGYAPGPNQAAYYASKAYVISLTRAIAYETRGLGVRVAVVCPGPVETRFHARMGSDTALYRYLIRGLAAETVARATVRGYRWGARVILPGVFTPVLALAMSLSPRYVSSPIIGLLLRRRGTGDVRRT